MCGALLHLPCTPYMYRGDFTLSFAFLCFLRKSFVPRTHYGKDLGYFSNNISDASVRTIDLNGAVSTQPHVVSPTGLGIKNDCAGEDQ
jgi:hypothetical protein